MRSARFDGVPTDAGAALPRLLPVVTSAANNASSSHPSSSGISNGIFLLC
jgi:hypothetical protein